MNVELNEEGYTLDGKWKLVPVKATEFMFKYTAENTKQLGSAGKLTMECTWFNMLHVSPKPEFKESESIIKYKSDAKVSVWCKQCGADFINGNKHLQSCPTLKSKL